METAPISPAEVPGLIDEISNFLTRTGTMFLTRNSAMGAEVAFWRAKSSSGKLATLTEALAKLCQHPTYFQEPASQRTADITALARLHAQIGTLVDQIPFESRVNLLHRSLIPVYQQVYVLQNLVASVLCRLRHAESETVSLKLQPGSLLSVEARRELRDRFRESVPSWDRKDWNLYDDV